MSACWVCGKDHEIGIDMIDCMRREIMGLKEKFKQATADLKERDLNIGVLSKELDTHKAMLDGVSVRGLPPDKRKCRECGQEYWVHFVSSMHRCPYCTPAKIRQENEELRGRIVELETAQYHDSRVKDIAKRFAEAFKFNMSKNWICGQMQAMGPRNFIFDSKRKSVILENVGMGVPMSNFLAKMPKDMEYLLDILKEIHGDGKK